MQALPQEVTILACVSLVQQAFGHPLNKDKKHTMIDFTVCLAY